MTEPHEKKVVWIGSSLNDLKDLPEEVQDEIGYVLSGVQHGEYDSSIRPLKSFSGVYEIRTDFDRDTYRAVYVVNLADVIYVLHVFKKKSKQGIETPKQELSLIRARLARAQEDAHERERRQHQADTKQR